MKPALLLTPGPTPVPESALRALSRPLIHHRTDEFKAFFRGIRSGLKALFQTQNEVITLCCTGTGAMEATLVNLCSPGDIVITINAGKFGERWTKIARAYGVDAREFLISPGDPLDLKRLGEFVAENVHARAIFFQASETSTGARLPTREITALARTHGMLSVCDAITACGVFDLPMDEWEIDAMITGSQKALMIPPGLAFVAFGPRAWAAAERSTLPKFYFDLRKELKAQLKDQTAWSPATSHLFALEETLRLIQVEGLPRRFHRHAALGAATRAAVLALGLELLSPECPSDAVTAVKVPRTIPDGKAIPKGMRAAGVIIAGGQDALEGKIFRLSHFGAVGPDEILTGISTLEQVLVTLGVQIIPGSGVGAAKKVLSAAGLI